MRCSLPVIVLLLAGCGRVVLLDCDDVPAPAPDLASWPATCEGSTTVLCRDPATGERCVPHATECRPDGDARCLSELGVQAPALEVVCLSGDVNEAEILRTTRTCAEVLATPEGEDPPL